ncbi:hypothetical protein RFI_17570 [Reticulomyxa filosa]|uniref:Uncharacterized protein n=1 Tax=Reticulomyxa filosa TaxID=46433 RepID=X6N050_RETFI|nr:hypothetical protein RFI_17570 [Reticulomyxa filosa]|eukprot:ETO19660.1 hypothetical protein RFI_17570 [Reticulomyxa filosa]
MVLKERTRGTFFTILESSYFVALKFYFSLKKKKKTGIFFIYVIYVIFFVLKYIHSGNLMNLERPTKNKFCSNFGSGKYDQKSVRDKLVANNKK